MRALDIHEQNRQRHHRAAGGQHLADTQSGARYVQAVCAQPLDHGPSGAVPEHVEQEHLPVVLAVVLSQPVAVDYDKAHEVPQALIQEGRVDVHRLLPGSGETHAAEDVGLIAEGLAVHEIRPAAYDLAEYQSGGSYIQGGSEGYLLAPGPDDDGYHARYGAAVHGYASVADVEYLYEVVPELIPLRDNIVDAAADYGQRQHPEHQRKNVVALDAHHLGALGSIEHRREKGDGHNDAVEVYLIAENGEAGREVYRPVPQHGKAYRGVAHHGWHCNQVLSFGSTVESTSRSGLRYSRTKPLTSSAVTPASMSKPS